MKIGIIVHSQTGNTHTVAVRLQEQLAAAGHTVTVERLKFVGGDEPGLKSFNLENPPDTGMYEALVFGAPVHAFNLSRGMEKYLSSVPSLQGKTVALFVTKGLRFHWAGGTQAIGKMKKICVSKGATVCDSGIVVWNEEREKQIAAVVDTLSRCF